LLVKTLMLIQKVSKSIFYTKDFFFENIDIIEGSNVLGDVTEAPRLSLLSRLSLISKVYLLL